MDFLADGTDLVFIYLYDLIRLSRGPSFAGIHRRGSGERAALPLRRHET